MGLEDCQESLLRRHAESPFSSAADPGLEVDKDKERLSSLGNVCSSKSELAPHVPIVVVRLKGQIQPIVGSEVANQVAELHDALVGHANLPQLLEILIRNPGGISVHFEREVYDGPESFIRNRLRPFQHEALDLLLIGFQTMVQYRAKSSRAIWAPVGLETAIPTCWISSILNSPICHKILVAPSFALKNSGKFIST